MLNSGNGDTSAISEPASQISFDNNDTINYEEQLQKQKDLEACFGFKVCLFFFAFIISNFHLHFVFLGVFFRKVS